MKEKEFKTLKAFLDDARKRKETSGMQSVRSAKGDHVKVSPEEQEYLGHKNGYFSSGHNPSSVPPTGTSNPALGNVKAFT